MKTEINGVLTWYGLANMVDGMSSREMGGMAVLSDGRGGQSVLIMAEDGKTLEIAPLVTTEKVEAPTGPFTPGVWSRVAETVPVPKERVMRYTHTTYPSA